MTTQHSPLSLMVCNSNFSIVGIHFNTIQLAPFWIMLSCKPKRVSRRHEFPPYFRDIDEKWLRPRLMANCFEDVDRAIDNLVKSGKLFSNIPRRDSVPLMMGRPYTDFGMFIKPIQVSDTYA